MKIMKIGQFVVALAAVAMLGGCATGYGYRGGGGGDYYYGRSTDYYGYGAPYGSIGYGYPGYGYGGYGYGYSDYGYGYPYGGYGYGYPYYPYYPHNPRPRPRPDHEPRPGKPTQPLTDSGIRYPSRAREALRRGDPSRAIPSQPQRVDMGPRYPSRVPPPRAPQVRPGLESRGDRSGPSGLPPPAQPAATPRFESRGAPRSEPRFESRPARPAASSRSGAAPRSYSRDRDSGREQAP